MITSLQALSHKQELEACKAALLAQINEKRREHTDGCPVGKKLVFWLGILRDADQFTPQELITFLNSHSHWPHYEKLCLKAEEVIYKKGSPQEHLAWFEAHPPKTPNGVIAYASALLAQNEEVKAAKIVQKAWQSLEFSRAEEKNFLAQFSHFLQTKDHIARLQFFLWEENIGEAKRLLAHVPENVRKNAEVRIAFLSEKPNDHHILQSLPFQVKQDEGVLFAKTKWHRKKKDFTDAYQILLKTPLKTSYAQQWWKERNYIARELIALQKYEEAYQVLKNHALEPGSESFAEAEWLLGWLSLRFLNRPEEALNHFMTLSANVRGAISKSRGGYWLGRAYEAQGQYTLAEKSYRKAANYKTTYYGQLAAAKLRERPHPTLASNLKADSRQKQKFEQNELVKAAYILKGLGKAAAHELSKFLLHIADKAETKEERELAVHLAHALSPHDVVWAAKKAGYSDPVLLKVAFPSQPIPKKGQFIPNKSFVMAIIHQESGFNPLVESSAGAIGLMQLMPETAALEAKNLGVSHQESKLYDPHHNIHLGTAHLSKLLEKFDQSYVLASAAYNAGATPVQRWLKEFGDPRQGEVDIIDWIELIPYRETRSYLMRVLANMNVYRSLFGNLEVSLVDDLRN